MKNHAQQAVYHWLLPWLQCKKHSGVRKQKCCDFKIQHLPQRINFLTIEFMERKLSDSTFYNSSRAFRCHWQLVKKKKPSSDNSHRSPILVKLPHFLEIYLWRQTNAVLSLLLHFWSLWHTPVELSRTGRAFKRGIRTELNWITPPLPFLMTAINFCKWCRW